MSARTPLVVSDHALVRYLERVRGIDLDDIRREIARTVEAAYQIGAQKYSKDGFTYCFRGNAVATIDPSHSPGASTVNGFLSNGGTPVPSDRFIPKAKKSARMRRPAVEENWRDEIP